MTTAIYSKNSTQSAIQVNGVDAVVIDAGGIVSGATGGFRNRIINGNMGVDQRNIGAAITPAAAGYCADRWSLYASQASKLTLQQVVDAPPGFYNSTKISVAAAFTPAASDSFTYAQVIEANNYSDFQFGFTSAQPISVSFWVKASVPGTYAVGIRGAANARSYAFNYTATTAWTQVKVLIPGDVTGSWLTGGTGAGINMSFDLGTGSSLKTTANTWQAGNFLSTTGGTNFVSQVNASTINFTGVQLELGAVATSFEQRSIGAELLLCLRYYQAFQTGFVGGFDGITTRLNVAGTFPVSMRVIPSLTLLTSPTVRSNNTTISSSAASIAISFPTTTGVALAIDGFTGGTANAPATINTTANWLAAAADF